MLKDKIDHLFNINSLGMSDDKKSFGIKTLQLRLKDKHDPYLTNQSNQVNLVWNFCNEHSIKVLQRENRFCSAYDIHPFLAGSAKEGLNLHSQTIQAIADEYVIRRKQFKKSKLRWRVSKGSRRSLGWIPFKQSAITYKNGQLFLAGKALSLWDSYGLADYELGSGSISQDSRGRWYINITVKARVWTCAPLKDQEQIDSLKPRNTIGIDLGLKDFIVSSNGEKITAQKIYRNAEEKLAIAQRANKPKLVKSIHSKIRNQRKDAHHKLSKKLVGENLAIFVGNVSSSGLAKTNMAKSVLDSGWSSFRNMLMYKSTFAGVYFEEVSERFSTQDCSVCSSRSGPKGLEGLNVRQWTCPTCLTLHDRDINAALNIKSKGCLSMNKKLAIAVEVKASESAMNKALYEETLNVDLDKAGNGHVPLVAGILCL